MKSNYYNTHEKVVQQRSITPETYKNHEVKFVKHKVLSINKTSTLEDEFFYVDKYEYKKSNVLHFGINTYSKELISEIELSYNANVSKDKLLDLKSIASIISQKDKVILNIEELKKTSKILLTEFEKISINEAISYLANNINITTALVDVFVRDADNKVIIKNGEPETHTAVLYKQDGKYLVIDPSNANFSRILAGVSDDVILCHSNKLQIYMPPSDKSEIGIKLVNKYGSVTGVNNDQYRDCIDIAVKLAFNLNANLNFGINKIKVVDYGSNVYAIDYQSLREYPTIKEITNQQELYKLLPGSLEVFPVRVKQSSDVTHEKKITTVLKFLNYGKFQLESKESKTTQIDLYHIKNKIEKESTELFNKEYNSKQYDEAIKDFCVFTNNIFDIVGSNEQKLLGMELNAIDEL